MAVESLDPSGLGTIEGITQVSLASGSQMVFFSGQTGRAAAGTPAGSDLRAQTAQALRNLEALARAVGVTASDIAKTTTYIMGLGPEKVHEYLLGLGDYHAGGGTVGTAAHASTMVGVTALYAPWCLVEIDAIAVLE